MWMIVLLACSTHTPHKHCSPVTAKGVAEIHEVYGLHDEIRSCQMRIDALKKRKPKKGVYFIARCEPDDVI